MPEVYVVIVTCNGEKWVENCFDSLKNSSYPVETIVVDNSSTDNTVPRIKKAYSDVILIESDINLGFGRANNIGIKYALENQADYVFLLNQDAWIEKETIEKMLTKVYDILETK